MEQIKKSNEIKIAYIGGGSRNWAWAFMSDLAVDRDMGGEVALYDIDFTAAQHNESIGNNIPNNPFRYKAQQKMENALRGADFVIVSILPGTFDEMHSDVHTPEEYGIWQPVGDTSGPGGIVRAIRTIPQYVEIALAIEKYAPNAWVINYTNPMTMCVDTLYRVFPNIKAFGCCHEVFSTQDMMAGALETYYGIRDVKRKDIKVNVMGINHFTWINEASYKNIDLYPMYEKLANDYYATGVQGKPGVRAELATTPFQYNNRVKFDLFRRMGTIAAAGDRHLAEFCPGWWYLESPKQVEEWGFHLTTVDYRKNQRKERLAESQKMVEGKAFDIKESGEEGVLQMKALMGLGDFTTNVNLPNRGQITNLRLGDVVETNAHFTSGMVKPVVAGDMPEQPHGMTTRIADNFRVVVDSCLKGDIRGCYKAFINDPLVTIAPSRAEELFEKMIQNTKKYLGSYSL